MFAAPLCAVAAIDGFDAEGLPYAHEGFGVRRNFYQSGRISAKVADIAGIFELDYVGKQPFMNQRFYSSNEQCTFCRCMVPQVLIDDKPYRLTFKNTVHYPFGYSSECTVDGVKLRHEFILDRNVVFRRVTVVENPEGKRVRCRIVQMNAGMGQGAKWKTEECKVESVKCKVGGCGRRLVAEAGFEDGTKVTMEIGAANPVAFPINELKDARAFPGSPDSTQNFRFDMEETEAGDSHLFWWVFDKTVGEEFDDARVERVYADFKARHAADARFETGDAFVDGLLGFVAPMSAAHEVDGIGAFRASPTYWVWGWDAMVHSGALAICGRAAEVRRMLRFYMERALEDGRIHHAYTTGLSCQKADLSAPGEVCFDAVNSSFWLVLLNDYVNATGDEAFKAECMDFARRIVEKNRKSLRQSELLVRGQGLFPDNRYPLGQEKEDYVLFNCSVYWQGLCAWRELSGEGAEDCEAVAKEIVAKFWDAKSGYWGDSWNAAESCRRDWRPLHGLYHVSSAARAIMPGDAGKVCDLMEKEFLLGDRLAMFARSSSIRCADGNQYSAYYPVVDRTFWNMQNRAGRTGAIGLFRRIVAANSRVLTYPEGQTVDVANPDPADYSDELGNKQFFSEKAWLADALDLWLGLGVEKDGLRLHPMNDGKPFAVRGLALRGKTLDIVMTGIGSHAALEFNGGTVEGAFIPWDRFTGGRNTLRIVVSDECAEADLRSLRPEDFPGSGSVRKAEITFTPGAPLAGAEGMLSRAIAPWNGTVTGVSTNIGTVCVDYALRPTDRSLIRCQLLLPAKEKWSGRFWGQGNGGQAGGKPRAMPAFANAGDAVAHTDMGTSDDRAYGNPEVWTDFSHRATHLMTLSAKALIKAHYDRPPDVSYFYGASTGGNQGLMEAERYPDDYDAVLAIVPAFARVPYHVKYVWNARQVFRPDGSRALTDQQIATVEKAVLDWFADKDEPYARGKYLARAFWTAADMDGVLSLAASRDPSIGANDIKARFRAVWDGPVINGRRAGLGLPPGARLSTWLSGTYTSKESWLWNWFSNRHRPLLSIADDELEAWAKGPAKQFNATNPDLSRFFARGGVLLMTGGAEDDICEPAPMIAFANEVIARNPAAAKTNFRFYLNPGRAHGGVHRGLCDLENMWSALVVWREKGEAPDVMQGVWDWSEKGFPDDVYGGKSKDARRLPVAPWPEKMSGSDETGWRRVSDYWPVGGAIDPIYFMCGAGGACILPASAAATAAPVPGIDARTGTFEEMVAMPDGTRLYTYGVRPAEGVKFPIVIKRNPYVDEKRVDLAAFEKSQAGNLARGYAYLVQHCRGCGMSEGDWIPYENERSDGLALLEWVRRLPWYNGEIFLEGGSYLASVHWSYLDTNPPDVKGACLFIQDVNRYNIVYRNGFFKAGLHGGWFSGGYKKKNHALKRDKSVSFADFPLMDFSMRYWGEAVPALDNNIVHPWRDDPYWSSHEAGSGADYRRAFMDSTMPILLATGFYDIYTEGICDMWRETPRSRLANCALLIDAYDHGGREANDMKGTFGEFPGGSRSDEGVSPLDWFDYCRTGKPCAKAAPGKVRYYALWENRWVEADSVADGGRRVELPLGEGERSWTYDPRRPLPNFPGSGGICFGGMRKQPEPDFRDDVVSFVLPPLEERLDVRGRMKAVLTVKSDCEDTCFYVRVSVRKSDGGWYLLRDDITSLSAAGGDYVPGEMRRVEFRFADHAFRLEKGDQLRVDVASACSQFAPHGNVKGLQCAVREPKVAHNAVDAGQSRLVLFCIDGKQIIGRVMLGYFMTGGTK